MYENHLLGRHVRVAARKSPASASKAPVQRVKYGKPYKEHVNPGAIFETIEDAAFAANGAINRTSIRKNTEFGFGYVQDPKTGLYGYTDFHDWGPEGGQYGLPRTVNGAPLTGKYVGMGHTHGAYSKSKTGRHPKSVFNMPHEDDNFSTFSGGDMDSMQQRQFDFYTLGTPSGNFRKWTPESGTQLLLGRVRPQEKLSVSPRAVATNVPDLRRPWEGLPPIESPGETGPGSVTARRRAAR